MTPPRACTHCGEVITRPATRWVHKDTGRRACGPDSHRTAEPQARLMSRDELANDPGWRQVAALYANGGAR